MKNQLHPSVWLSFLALAAACSDTAGPRVQPCTAQNSVSVGALGVADYASVTPGADGCARFAPNNGADTIEYLVVAQSVASAPNRKADFRLAGEAMLALPPTSVMASLQAFGGGSSPASQFHTFLREAEARREYAAPPPGTELQSQVVVPPPQPGEQRTFKVCSDLRCQPPMLNVTAVVKAVGQKLALYVDLEAQNSLTQQDYDDLVAAFDQRVYPIDTAAFGAESDVDNNQVVMALMTPAINRLVSDSTCRESGFVAGYFFGADLDPAAIGNPNFNRGELFYTVVPDPTGNYSCSHTVQRVKELVPVVFAHELQHMISFNNHVLKASGGTLAGSEVLWLNEAMSHYAEEIVGRTYLPGDNATFSAYMSGNIRNAYDYLEKTDDHFLVAEFGNGTLGERGAGWLFMRFLVDQMAADTSLSSWNVVTRQLSLTTTQGVANIEQATGAQFDQTLTRWALALWVSDLVGFTAPPELRYRSWQFRTTYGALSPGVFPRPYPLVPPVTVGAQVDVSGTLRSGSGVYERVLHPPGPSFTLQLADPNGGPMHPALEPRITVIRVR